MIALTPITPEQEKAALTAAQHMPAKAETTQQPASYMNATSIQKLDTAGDRVEFFSRVFSSPAESTILRAVKKGWIRFPGIADRILRRHKHRLRTPESAAGHLDQVQQNQKRQERQDNPPKLAAKEHTLQHIDIVTYIHREENHMDATARFTTPSHDGYEYTLIMVAIQGNYIHAELMKTRHKSRYLSAHQAGLQFSKSEDMRPHFSALIMKPRKHLQTICMQRKSKLTLHHHINIAETRLKERKNHVIGTFAGVDPQFPMCAWSELIPQLEITVNYLRPSHMHTRMSAWEALNGTYNFDTHPLAPPGTAITIHEKPAQRRSWAKHGVKGFYLGPALNHYRCYTVWAQHTGAVRKCDTVAFHPHGYQWESYSPLEQVTHTADALTQALIVLANSDASLVAQH